MQPVKNSVLSFGMPTKTQALHGIERTLFVFVLAFGAYLKITPDPWTKAAWAGAGFAGIVAVYEAVISTITSL